VGHDFGAFNGLEWASAHPRRLQSVTLLDGGILPDDYPGHGFSYVNAIPGLGETFHGAQNYETFRAGFSPPVHPPLAESFIARMYEEYDDPGSRRATPLLYRSFADYRERSDRWIAALRPYDLPARVLWGEADPFVPARIAEYQLEAFPSADVRVLTDIGHFPFAEAPRETRRFIVPFLRSQLR
jgi:pimeloyl-ACP methyl ester carboxylesterase